jgi:hypothetical protein
MTPLEDAKTLLGVKEWRISKRAYGTSLHGIGAQGSWASR